MSVKPEQEGHTNEWEKAFNPKQKKKQKHANKSRCQFSLGAEPSPPKFLHSVLKIDDLIVRNSMHRHKQKL